MTGTLGDSFDGAATPHRRAPRLTPDERIADHLTRGGRFAAVDPRKPAAFPSVAKVVGALAWAALTVESFRRAWARRPDAEA